MKAIHKWTEEIMNIRQPMRYLHGIMMHFCHAVIYDNGPGRAYYTKVNNESTADC